MRNNSLLMYPPRPKTWAEARVSSLIPLAGARPATVDERIAYAQDVGILTARQKETLELIEKAVEPPLRAYAKWFEELMAFNEAKAKAWRKKFPLDEYIDLEFEYRKSGGKSTSIQLRGASGSGKSLGGQGLTLRHHPDFDVYRGTHFSYDELVQYLQSHAKNGMAIVQDEEPKSGGYTSRSIDDMLENLELTVFRRKQIDSCWIYVEQRSHRVQGLLSTDKEGYEEPGKLQYIVFQASVPYANSADFLWVGPIVIRVPDKKHVDEYLKRKDDFVEAMTKSGGRGQRRELSATLEPQMKDIMEDPAVKYVLEQLEEAETPKAKETLANKLARYISGTWGAHPLQAESFVSKHFLRGR